MRILKVIITLAAMVLASSAMADKRVVNGALTLMDGPGKVFHPVLTMRSGTRVELLEVYEGWGLIKLRSGMKGWARASRLVRPGAVSRAPAAAPKPVDVDNYASVVWPPKGNLNLRAGPGTSHPVTMVMTRGDIVEVSQKAGKWAYVRCMTGEEGWTFASYLSK